MAVVDKETNTLCTNKQFGRRCSGEGNEIRYCREHIPSGAILGGRINPVKFYISEKDVYETIK